MSDMSKKVREALDVAVEAIGGAPREGQIEMAEAVANALTDRHHLMVQAGTGTGKSLAYLIPGIVHGRKVLVATATLALQRQLVDRDLPAVVPALEKLLGREITYAIYKGVGNYVCLQKMNSEDVDPDAELVMEISSLEKDAKRLIAWAKTPGCQGIEMMHLRWIGGYGQLIVFQVVSAWGQMSVLLVHSALRQMLKVKRKLQM